MTPQGFVDIDDTLVYSVVLQPSQVLTGQQQPIDNNGDFYLKGMQAMSALAQRPDLVELAGNVGIRIYDDTGYALSSDYINIAFLTSINGNSYPWAINEHLIKAGTRITIDLEELSNASDVAGPIPNVVQIAFRGTYRFRTAELAARYAALRQAKKLNERG